MTNHNSSQPDNYTHPPTPFRTNTGPTNTHQDSTTPAKSSRPRNKKRHNVRFTEGVAADEGDSQDIAGPGLGALNATSRVGFKPKTRPTSRELEAARHIVLNVAEKKAMEGLNAKERKKRVKSTKGKVLKHKCCKCAVGFRLTACADTSLQHRRRTVHTLRRWRRPSSDWVLPLTGSKVNSLTVRESFKNRTASLSISQQLSFAPLATRPTC